MLTWLKSLFQKEDLLLQDTPSGKYGGFKVEYYPTSEKYFASYKGRYLKRMYPTNVVELLDYHIGILFAESFSTEDKAWRLIDQFIEEQTKATVKVFTR